MGFLGMVFGMIPIQKINTWVERRWLFGGLYLCYLAVISVFRQGYLSEPIGVCLNLGILYAIGRRFSNGLFGKRIMLVGNYSLLGYIFHVFVLQLLSRFAGQGPSQTHVFIVAFGVTVLLTWFTIQFVDWMRTRSSSVDAIYKAIF
jgi:peptidoglycan/LPS O-acetylase OafA/YrhL